MKRFIATLAFTLILTASFSFANAAATPGCLASFHQSFSAARNISWTEAHGLTRISFTLDDSEQVVFYNEAGDLVAQASKIGWEQLPSALQSRLQQRYGSEAVRGLYRMHGENGAAYMALVSGKEKNLVLSASGKKWTVLQKRGKSAGM